MAVVTFTPDRAVARRRRSPRRTALVLGAGGVLGAAWMTGALACLQDWLQHPLDDADLIVGTSAGSVLAAALRCRATVEEMAAWQRGDAASILGEPAAPAAQDGPLPPLPRLRFGSLPLAAAAVLRPDLVPPWVGATGWLPHGRGQHASVRALVTALHARHHNPGNGGTQSSWADGRTWIAATDYATGQRVLFGQDGAPQASLPDAVVASCSIPGWYQPATIGGRRYVDGGVRCLTSLGTLSGTDVHDIFVLAPLASTEPDHPVLQPHLCIERRLRHLMTLILLRQAKMLAARGQQVTILTPGPQDLAVMGANPMDRRRREAVLETSFRTSAAVLASAHRHAA